MPARTSLKGHRRTRSCYSDPFRLTSSWCRNRYGIPIPRAYVEDSTRKSHAKKQPKGHIPRPRNKFMLFRCNFVNQGLVPRHEFEDHSIISKIASLVWHSMSPEEKAPWVEMAEAEEVAHAARYGTRNRRARKVSGTECGDDDDDDDDAISPSEYFKIKLEAEEPPFLAFASKHRRAGSEPAHPSYAPWFDSMNVGLGDATSTIQRSGSPVFDTEGMYFKDDESVLSISPSDLNADLGLPFSNESFPHTFVRTSHHPDLKSASVVDPSFNSDHESKCGHGVYGGVQRLADYREYRIISHSSNSGRLDAILSASHLNAGSPSCPTGYDFDEKVTIKVKEAELKLVDDFMNWRGLEE